MNPATHAQVLQILDAAAHTHGIEPALLRALAFVESGFNPDAVSSVGAKGLCQLMDGTAKDLGVHNAFDPSQNANGAARYLHQLLDRFAGNVDEALAAYNWGFRNVEKRRRPELWPATVRLYVRRIKIRCDVERELGGIGAALGDKAKCPMCGRPYVDAAAQLIDHSTTEPHK